MPHTADRLGAPFTLSRDFNAPRELVWQALDATDEENATAAAPCRLGDEGVAGMSR